jgi:UDP-N-acetylglucosamine--N-acetylmuramyl-(pentapeptide) pyrophosphoryl-undecaprenol N-acetylglucosamine transferase
MVTMKRILLTGGGSAGHVTPNIALLPTLQRLEFDIHYIGRQSGIERELIEPLGIPYHPINAGKLRRYLDMQNLTDIFRIAHGFFTAFFLIGRLRPVVVFSKGGFVACPVVWAAWLHRIPVIIHESDLTPGLANKLSAPFASRICYSFPETEAKLPSGKAVYIGIPIRESLLSGKAVEGRRICGFTNDKPVILVMGGSQGAAVINDTLRDALDELLKRFNVCHLCGQGLIDDSRETMPGYKQFEYVKDDLPHLLAMADIVVSRAGATTLFELLALKKPNLLIPLSLKASRGDQIVNARSFEKQGFSAVLPQEELCVETLIAEITRTYTQRDMYSEAMRSTTSVNAVEVVMKVISACIK